MRRFTLAASAVVLLALAGAFAISRAAAQAPSYACAGVPPEYVAAFDAKDGAVDGKVSYSERRVWLEDQSWWEPQEANATWWPNGHPGAGKQGHIHVNFCTPLGQSLSGSALPIDFNLKLHNITGRAIYLQIHAYGDHQVEVPRPLYGDGPNQGFTCSGVDCERNVSYDFPLSGLHYGGWHYLYTPLIVFNEEPGVKQYNVNRWQFFADNGKPAPPCPSFACNVANDNQNVAGDSWYQDGTLWTDYARSDLSRAEMPWDETTGALKPLSGTWTITPKFQGVKRFAYIDPKLHHADPAMQKGIVVLEDTAPNIYSAKQISIDTTTLANGLHYLLIGNTVESPSIPGNRHSGILKLPFLVHNACNT